MKRKLAGLLSLTMILSSMSINVFAESLPATVGGDNGIDGTSSVNAIDTVKYRMILPTNAALNYVADPQGLAQLGETGSQDVADISGGKVYSKGDVVIANRSSKDVTVTAEVKATDQAAETGKTVVNVKDALTTDWGTTTPTPEVVLAVVPSVAEFTVDSTGTLYNKNTNAVGEANVDADKYVATTTTSSADAKTGYKLQRGSGSDTKVSVPVVLKKADYVAKATTTSGTTTYDYAVAENSIGGAVSFSIAGYCSTDDSWSKAGADLKAPTINVKYTFANASTADLTALGEDSVKVIETTGLSKATDLQTAPLLLVNVDDDNVSVAKTGVTLKLFATDSANEAVKTNIATKPVAVTYLKVGDGSVVTNATAEVADDGTITITNTGLASAAADTEVVVKISYDGKLYVAKGSVVIPPTAATATATTEAITIDAIDGVAGIEDVEFTVMVDGEDDPIDVTAALDEDDNIVLTPEEGALEADDKLTITFTIGETNYKAEATVEAAYSTVEDVTLPTSGNALEIPVSIGSLGGVPTKFNGINMYGDNKTYELIGTEGSWGATYDSANAKIILGADVAAWMIENAETTKAATFEVEFDKGEKASFAFK